ncbi:PhzF family phenazine biosynthesis protein [Prochlorothrix hollandica]|uniref:PhzF family phenazine biosynthesis protein n=1 Tax=Prochlorothrix hollandica TaxID=1223 RepID=UPI0033413FD2
MAYRFYTLDVFSDRPFGGNPLAVLPQATGLTTAQMQQITREFNLSETVFVLPPETPQGACRLRIFTPGQEVAFAGHPTVGTAFLLTSIGQVPLTGSETPLILEEGVGPVPVVVRAEGDRPVFSQLSAAQPPDFMAVDRDLGDLAAMVGSEPEDFLGGEWEPEGVSCGMAFCYLPLASRSALVRAQLHRDRWQDLLGSSPFPHVYCFCFEPEDPSCSVRSRMFAPALGITEDPATGAAATALAGYLARRQPHTSGTLRWGVEQGVEMGRPSFLAVEADQVAGQTTAIRVGGRSVLISEGTLYL